MEIKFDRESARKNILHGLGISPESTDEELKGMFVTVGSFFSDDSEKINAHQYVVNQLDNDEMFYNEFYSNGISQVNEFKPVSENDIMTALSNLDFDKLPDSIPVEDLSQIPDSLNNKFLTIPTVFDLSFRYFVVNFEGNEYVIVINEPTDRKTFDQIKHIENTSYFIEEKNSDQLADTDIVISYYQFVNMMERSISRKNAEIRSKIEENVKTQFSSLDTIVNPFSDD
jgi:hypothetical protein